MALAAAPGQAACGASSCEPEAPGPRPIASRTLRLGYEFARGGPSDDAYAATRPHRMTAALGLSPRWSAALQLGGVEDLFAEARYAFRRSARGSTWSLGVGGEFPAARAHASAGAGSTDATTGLIWQRPVGGGGLWASVMRRFNGPGGLGYRAGDAWMAHVGGAMRIAARLTGTLQLSALSRERDWAGRSAEDTRGTGGDALFAAPGLELSFGDASVAAAIQWPLYERTAGHRHSALGFRAGLGYRIGW
ncbi:MAG: hypothetical protein HY553_19855 [Elusimicrobia bacterium]|nr:hypothetical protein [Elusimicrobiota bacterium]